MRCCAVQSAVVLFRVVEEGEQNFVDTHSRVETRGVRRPVRCGFEFEFQPCEGGSGLWGVVHPRQEALLAGAGRVRPDGTGAAGLFVEKVRRGGVASSAHCDSSPRGVE